MALSLEQRRDALALFGAGPDQAEELLRHNRNDFDVANSRFLQFPRPDEPHLDIWNFYASQVKNSGDISAIFQWLPQLQFPIRENLSAEPQYITAVTRGEWVYPHGIATGLDLADPRSCSVEIYATPAGRIPAIIAGQRADFVTLVRAFTRRGSPAPVPDSKGATIVAGYNNFHRIHGLRQTYFEKTGGEGSWKEEFATLKQHKHLYQDTFIILSTGPYSGVPASRLNLTDDEWKMASLTIRREHECTHYFTRRVFGSMKNEVFDELIADYCGIVEAAGSFRADWAAHFLGLEDERAYRPGSRLENYCRDLSKGAFQVMERMVRSALGALAMLDAASASKRRLLTSRVATLHALASLSLEEIAAPEGGKLLCDAFERYFAWFEAEPWSRPAEALKCPVGMETYSLPGEQKPGGSI